MGRQKQRIKFEFDPIATMIKAIQKWWPEFEATVCYMNNEYFEKHGAYEWSIAEGKDGDNIVFVNPHRTVLQIAVSIAKGAVAFKIGLNDDEFDESSPEFQNAVVDVLDIYGEMVE